MKPRLRWGNSGTKDEMRKKWNSGRDEEASSAREDGSFYAQSASKAIFRARTYNCITYSVR